jgi:NAD(P)-dependent dehydrogenase (short-subunit alcohol dehydrogenase family)
MSRYVAAHTKTNGPGDARPTALQIVKDEGLEKKLNGKVMVVTGCSSGIGIETVRALHATGATVIGTARDITKAQAVVDEIYSADTSIDSKIHIVTMELDSFESIRAGAKEILKLTNKLNILVNNAGVMATPDGRTKDGFETQYAVNKI